MLPASRVRRRLAPTRRAGSRPGYRSGSQNPMIHHVTAPLSEPAGADDSLGEAVGRAQLGDSAAFSVLYREVQPRLLRYLTGLVSADAEDVASEAWLQISRDLRTFTGTGD